MVYSCAIHVATDTGTFDQSTLKSVNPMQKPLRRGRALGRAAHLPLVTFRPPQAAALSVKIGNKAGGTEGKEPSLHMDAFASILRPLSPYGHDRRGLPSFPRMSALRCCSSSVRRGIMCCGIGGQGAWQPSLRSGRLRRPARAEQDNSRRRTPCPQCRFVVRRAGASLLAAHA